MKEICCECGEIMTGKKNCPECGCDDYNCIHDDDYNDRMTGGLDGDC